MSEHRSYAYASRTVPAFTLVETLVVVGILAVLMSILIPALRSARGQMKSLMCASNLKTISLRFSLFAENRGETGQGKSEALGNNRFWIDDFQASMYGTGDFWTDSGTNKVTMNSSDELMLCPAGPRTLTKLHGRPFGNDAFRPLENVSIGMNGRLARGVDMNNDGRPVLAKKENTVVESSVLNHPYVPLSFDVDGPEALLRGVSPFYSAPPTSDADDPYSDGDRWNPSLRHRGATNVAFVGGHVLRSRRPSKETWDWTYRARVRRVDLVPR